jgi:dienelactone hydrolase
MRLIARTAVVVALLVLPAAASAYDEHQNWLNSYGRTVDHLSAPDRSIQNALISAERLLFVTGELDRIAGRGVQQTGAWPWNGDVDRGTYDRQGDWQGIKIEFEFPNETGQQLAATMWAPNDAMLDALGLDAPLPGVVYSGGVISAQPMYYWFAQEMARNGYVVMTYDVSGQGRSEGTSTGDAVADLRAALDFFVSDRNPLHRMLDRDRIGTAGHSMGAGAVQTVADHCGVVKAISAQSDLRATYPTSAAPEWACGPRRPVPVQGQGADYETFVLPPQPTPGSDPNGKLAGYAAARDAGIDVQELVIESGSHMAWSHVTWAYTATWSEQVAFHYSLAWFDRYLYGDMPRDGRTGTERLATVLEVDDAGHGVSKKFRSAYALGGARCDDMVAGTGCTVPARKRGP